MGTQGQFVWHELMTTDVEAAKAFYTEVIGWKIQPFDDGPKPYEMWCVGEQPIGGVMLLPEEAKAMGAPPHWLGHISTADVHATVAKVQELGGSLLVPAQKIPNVGEFAITADPQGVVTSVYTPATEMPAREKGNGEFNWNELNTTDWEAAWTYYSELHGWVVTESMDMGPEAGTYHMFKDPAAEKSVGGMSNMAKSQDIPPHWLFYATVADLDAALERVKSNGGQVVMGPMEVPGGDRVAQCMDPQGVAFALHCDPA